MLSFITLLGREIKAETLMVFGRESLRVAGIEKVCPLLLSSLPRHVSYRTGNRAAWEPPVSNPFIVSHSA